MFKLPRPHQLHVRSAGTSGGQQAARCSLIERLGRLASLAVCMAAIAIAQPTTSADETLEYNEDIRPILAENCFACHGPDSAARKADLRLDVRDEAIMMGAIAEGDPD